MQTFAELEKKWLDAHHKEYKDFTKMLLGYAIGSMTFLVAFHRNYATQDEAYRWMAFWALFGLLISALAGLLIQHSIMRRYLVQLETARRLQGEAQESGDRTPIEIRQTPSWLQIASYRVQVSSFAVSFGLLIVYASLNLV